MSREVLPKSLSCLVFDLGPSAGVSYISPHIDMMTSIAGLSRLVRTFSILRTTSMLVPSSTTLPNTTCLLFRNGVATVVMKNCEPFVLGPEFCDTLSEYDNDG